MRNGGRGRPLNSVVRLHSRYMVADPKTYGEVEGLVTMLMAACEDLGMTETLEMLLSAPNDRRKLVIYELLERFRSAGAPKSLHDGFTCLLDDGVAETAYEVIYRCKRKGASAT
jgi:hypothetical protein